VSFSELEVSTLIHLPAVAIQEPIEKSWDFCNTKRLHPTPQTGHPFLKKEKKKKTPNYPINRIQ
jgi:hypothetical protein